MASAPPVHETPHPHDRMPRPPDVTTHRTMAVRTAAVRPVRLARRLQVALARAARCVWPFAAVAAPALGCVKAELVPPPRVVCAGDSIPIRWNARGATSLAMRVSPGAASDSLTRADTVRLRLTAERFGRTAVSTPTEVVVATGRLTRPIGGRTAPLGRDSVVATFTVPDAEAPAYLRVAGVAAAGRPLTVSHGGRDAIVSAGGGPTLAFAGLPVAGAWMLRAALAPGEVIGDPQHPPPALLSAAVTATCHAGGT